MLRRLVVSTLMLCCILSAIELGSCNSVNKLISLVYWSQQCTHLGSCSMSSALSLKLVTIPEYALLVINELSMICLLSG